MAFVWVCGSANADLILRVPRLPQHGETVTGTEFSVLPGGKGLNQAIAAARMGAGCAFVGCVGTDDHGAMLRAVLADAGVDVRDLRCTSRKATGCALVTVSGADNTIVVVPGANDELLAEDLPNLSFARGDVVLGQLEIPPETTAEFFRRARARGARSVLNFAPAKDAGRDLLAMTDVTVLNETELAVLVAVDPADLVHRTVLQRAIERAQRMAGEWVIVTLGARGCVAYGGGGLHEVPAWAVEVRDTVGAGDCFTGVVAAQLASGASVPDAIHVGCAAAALCVQRPGAAPAMPTAAEVESFLRH